MTRSRLLIQASRQRQQRRAPRLGLRLVRGSAAAGHLAQQLEQHRPLGRAQSAV